LRNTGVGLRGKYGEAALGRWDSHYHFGPILVDQSYLTGPTAWSANSIIAFVGTSELIGNRFANTVRYNTPTWSGFTLHAIGSRGDGAVNNAAATGISNARDTSANVALTYRDAGLTGFISAYERRDFIMNLPYSAVATASLTSQRSVRAGIKHSWSNGLSVGALVDRSREGHEVPGGPAAFSGVRGVSRTAWALPVEYALGPHRISATYAKAGSAAGTLLPNSITATNAGSGADLKYVGYKYWLDQNTNLHAGWAQVSNKPNGAYDLYLNGGVGTDLRGNATARGTDVQTFQLGLFYRF